MFARAPRKFIRFNQELKRCIFLLWHGAQAFSANRIELFLLFTKGTEKTLVRIPAGCSIRVYPSPNYLTFSFFPNGSVASRSKWFRSHSFETVVPNRRAMPHKVSPDRTV